jgi:hypothetical protein
MSEFARFIDSSIGARRLKYLSVPSVTSTQLRYSECGIHIRSSGARIRLQAWAKDARNKYLVKTQSYQIRYHGQPQLRQLHA